MPEMEWSDFWSPVGLSLKVSLLAGIIAFLIAGYIAWLMAGKKFWGKTILETIFMLPMVLPPTVVGFLLLMAFGRRSPVGKLFETLAGLPIVFTWGAAVLSAAVVAFPLAYQSAKAGFASIDRDLLSAGRSMGASEWQVLFYIAVPLAQRSLTTAFVLSFTRALGEFGATLMLAGNIPGRTQTLPTAIYMAVESGDTTTAWAWAAFMILISFLLLALSGRRSEKEE
ncbi:molybdate ABC transporter permease subunit [Paenibacillus sp. Marseille-P2973]|uniref:molybdate ABC transporter permease subunit n=1 Tax=unclassified Paenibacillus TaxID=185978 RepID=UPI001B37D116|nr:molybdate ABC transporter permease subunit [Paenibacillus sp. Marseille-P2973]MBQ4899553.1 molybdate ABC transporter permease subunit [Paenibacillus sp. Marseille-P2973]